MHGAIGGDSTTSNGIRFRFRRLAIAHAIATTIMAPLIGAVDTHWSTLPVFHAVQVNINGSPSLNRSFGLICGYVEHI